VFGVSDDIIGQAIDEWCPQWGEAGEQLSILHITPEYLLKERPQEYLAQGFDKPGSLRMERTL
jgi:hypothetical protein